MTETQASGNVCCSSFFGVRPRRGQEVNQRMNPSNCQRYESITWNAGAMMFAICGFRVGS
jgi:hypothetical protein